MSARLLRHRLHAARADERGVIIVLFALLLVILMVMAGLVIEFGAIRDDRQSNKSSADFAVLAGMRSIDSGDPGTPYPWRGVCAAIDWLEANNSRFDGLTGTYRTGDGTTTFTGGNCDDPSTLPFDQVCVANTPSTWAWFRGLSSDGRLVVDIKSGYTLPDPDFAGIDSATGLLGGGDTGDPAHGGCDQFAVIVRQAQPRGFSSVIGSEDLESTIRSVGRYDITRKFQEVAALLLLERRACAALAHSGGAQGGGVVIASISQTNPGIVQADSAGESAFCANNTSLTNANAWVVHASELPSGQGGGPAIDVRPSLGGKPGRIQMWSLEVGGRGGAIAPSHSANPGLSVEPEAGPIISRAPADDAYNPTERPAITDLHRAGYLATTSVLPLDYTLVSGADCSGLAGTVSDAEGIYVACPTFTPAAAVLDAPEVIFTGKIDISGNGAFLHLPEPERVFVRGCVTSGSCTGAGDYSVNVSGQGAQLLVNTGNPSAAGCALRAGPGAGGTTTNTTAFATFDGPFVVGPNGLARMCQTTLYVGQNQPSYSKNASTSGAPNCTAELPCPKTAGSGDGYLSVQGNSDWSAPNQTSDEPDDNDPLEDLALWSESGENSFLKGVGGNRTEGVYFTPNSAVTFQGQADSNLPLNAQFWARRLSISGQGKMFMAPNPADSISAPLISGFSLVR